MNTLVIQSYKTENVPSWITRCMDTVQTWSLGSHLDYRFVGDEIFDLVPQWYMEKVAGRLPIATDYARLILIQQALDSGHYERVYWFDADTLIFDQNMTLEFTNTCAFGQEVWIQKNAEGKCRASKNVHNAVCVFKLGCPVLPFLIQTVASIIRRVEANRISPQMVGPKLLSALHNIAGFSLLPQAGALSPEVIADIVNGGGKALELFKLKSPQTPQASNLCASLVDARQAELVIDELLKGVF